LAAEAHYFSIVPESIRGLIHSARDKQKIDMMDNAHLICSSAIGVIAFLYSSVGHAGASGYIAVMTLGD